MADKHPGGRPRKFQSVAEMDAAIEAYFVGCDRRTQPVCTKEGIVDLSRPEPYTVTGLALLLGVDRKTLLNYEERADEFGVEFLPTIKRAKERIHHDLERRAYDGVGSTAGVIFGLKNNYAWKDVQEHTGSLSFSLHFDKQDADL